MRRSQRNKQCRDSFKQVKEKFAYERIEEIQSKKLVPLNEKQKYYMDLIRAKSVIVASGLAGTSKTYIPLCIAADEYRLGNISKIVVTRPAVSSSQSLGYFTGNSTEKLQVWLQPAISVLKERLGNAAYDIALNKGDIQFIPMEVIKGCSFNNSFVIAEESSDLTKDEIIKLITRVGKDSKLIISGDVRQSELNNGSGMKWLINFIKFNYLDNHFGYVDFNSVNDIVRSGLVKAFLTALIQEEEYERYSK